MRMKLAAVALGIWVIAAPAVLAPAAAPSQARAGDILPGDGVVPGSVAAIPNQSALDAHYYLADSSALALGRKADAVLARYGAAGRESLLLVIAYPTPQDAGRAYGRFGGDFFSESFDPMTPRVVERLETGDWAGAARRDRFLIIVLESPDRDSCDGLLGRAEARVASAKAR